MFLQAEVVCLGYPRHRSEFVNVDLDRQLREGCARAAVAFLDSGLNVILEQGLWDPWATGMARRVLGPRQFLVIGVTSSPEDAEAREVGRADRYPGTALQQRPEIQASDLGADLSVDTTDQGATELAHRITTWLSTGPMPRALREGG